MSASIKFATSEESRSAIGEPFSEPLWRMIVLGFIRVLKFACATFLINVRPVLEHSEDRWVCWATCVLPEL